jgi:hypothetical protein
MVNKVEVKKKVLLLNWAGHYDRFDYVALIMT